LVDLSQRFAILSDVNGNEAALDAVLEDAASLGIRRAVFLGDAIGYGPNPLECLEKLRVWSDVYLLGRLARHISSDDLVALDSRTRRAAVWTQGAVRSHLNWLAELPARVSWGNYTCVHTDPRDPLRHGIVLVNELFRVRDAYTQIFSSFEGVCFTGDNHVPWLLLPDGRTETPHPTRMSHTAVIPARAVISVGSVGQPRDERVEACYLIVDSNVVEWRRVPYDVKETERRIRANAEIGNAFGERLLRGI